MTDVSSRSALPPASRAEVVVRGERLVLRSDRSLFWPRLQWLIVADVHLGKTESLRRDGVALPDAVMDDDLRRLGRAVVETGAHRLLVLGDLVHDAHGMTDAMVRRVGAWRATLPAELSLVPGNHDHRVEELPASWHVQRLDERLLIGPFSFTHAPDAKAERDDVFNWHGHIHPVRTVRGGGDRVRLPCFCVGASAGLLPAFSALTGGVEVPCEPDVEQWVVVDDHILRVPSR